jgi:ABC-2 type transport system permease protein
MEFANTLLGVATFYYLGRFVETDQLNRALPYPSNYFAFALIGLAFFDYLAVSFDVFDTSLNEARQNGTLEAMLVTETPLATLLAGAAAYPFLLMTLRTAVYLAWGVLLFDFPVAGANWWGALLVLAISILAFVGLGIFSAGYLLLFKRSNPARWVLLSLAGLVGGMMYPVSVLPDWLQVVARLLPLTWSLEATRAALLGGAPLAELWPAIRVLSLFAAVLLPTSFAAFAFALRRTKQTGTLTHF